MPRPMCGDQAVQRLVFADALDERMSGCLVVTALDIEIVKPRLKDHRSKDRGPGLEEVNESLIG